MPYAGYGYVINADPGSTWLYEYRAYSESPRSFMGGPAEFKRWHWPVPILLGAKFGIWAFDRMEAARRKSDPKERELAMRRADKTGKVLALELRGEIGSGPVIVYVDQFHDPSGGPRLWQITDTCRLQPYWHVPSAGYVIHREDHAAWAWEYRPAGQHMIGGTVGDGDDWMGEHPMPRSLVVAFSRWQEQWRKAVHELSYDSGYCFDWDAHNAEGLALGHQLKKSLEDPAKRVVYLRPLEEPDERKSWKAGELLADGTHRPYVHAPYWGERRESSPGNGQT